MLGLKSYVRNLMMRLGFPDDAQKELTAAFETIVESSASDAFIALLGQYDADPNCDYKGMLSAVTQLADAVGIHPYTASLLLFLCMSRTLLERYNQDRPVPKGQPL